MTEGRDEIISLIRESAGAVVPADGGLARIRSLRQTKTGFDRKVWHTMAALGWPGLCVPEARGGSGLGATGLAALCERLGAGLVPEPLIGAVLAAEFLDGSHLEAVLGGERVILPALAPDGTVLRGDAVREGRVSVEAASVAQGGGADAVLVIAEGSAALIALDVVAGSARTRMLQDGCHDLIVSPQGAPVLWQGAIDPSPAMDRAVVATAAYLLGIADRAFELTRQYLEVRRQFDRPIGSFQALQHRMVDLYMQVELTRASVAQAARALDERDPLAPARASQARARAGDAALSVTRAGVQLHGAIGYTDEADIGLYLRKAMAMVGSYGSARAHRARFAALMPARAA